MKAGNVFRAMAVALLLIAGAASFGHGTAQQASPTPTIEPLVESEMVVRTDDLDMKVFAAWDVSLSTGQAITLPAVKRGVVGFIAEGSAVLNPESPSYTRVNGKLQTHQSFLWPDDQPVTLTNGGDNQLRVFVAGMFKDDAARIAFAGQRAEFSLIAAVDFEGQTVPGLHISFAQLELPASGQKFIASPWPWFGVAETASIIARAFPDELQDENAEPVGVSGVEKDSEAVPAAEAAGTAVPAQGVASWYVLPAHAAELTSEASQVRYWVIGLESPDSEIHPGCGGWKCAFSG